MSLTYPEPPNEVTLAFWNNLRKFLSPGDITTRILSNPNGNRWHVHQTYVVGLDDLIAGKTLAQAAAPVGWRFLIGSDNQAAVGYITARPGKPPRMTSLGQDDTVKHHMTYALEVNDKISEAAGQDYEVRYLTIPCLYIDAFWLVPSPRAGQNDLVFPYKTVESRQDPAEATLEQLERKAYTEEKFLEICKPLAVAQTEADKIDQPGLRVSYGWPPG
jgi:hypothetical protein